jgi:hypothetical protein
VIPGAPGYWCGMTTQHSDEPLGAVVHRLSEQLPELVRSELRLAQATPPAPERAIAGIKQDVEAVKGHH